MSSQFTSKNSIPQQPFRALALLLLMLCLLISCPLKRELKSIFSLDSPLENAASTGKKFRNTSYNVTTAELELACAKTVHSILDKAETSFLFQHFDFKNPILFLALSLAALYLLAVTDPDKISLHYAISGWVLTAKTPLFLRHQQLVI